MILRVHRVHRDPHKLRPDHPVACERIVEFGRVEPGEPVPQRDIGRCGLLRLQGHHAPHRVGNVQGFAIQQQLAGQGGPVELARGDPHRSGRKNSRTSLTSRSGSSMAAK